MNLIYIDKPYNICKDFVYLENFQDNMKNYLELTGQTCEGEIRQKLIEAELVDTALRGSSFHRKPVSIPGKLFYSAQISVCLWFLTKNEHDRKRHLSLCLRSTKTEFATTFSNNKNEEKKYIAPAKVEGATKTKGYFKRSSLSETQI